MYGYINFPYFYWCLVKVQMFGCAAGMRPMPFYTISIAITLMVFRRFILYTFLIFLFYLSITPLLMAQCDFLFFEIWGITTMSTMVLGIPSTTTTTSSSMSTSLGRYCIHFREWFKSNWTRLVISHQKLIILFNNKKTWY